MVSAPVYPHVVAVSRRSYPAFSGISLTVAATRRDMNTTRLPLGTLLATLWFSFGKKEHQRCSSRNSNRLTNPDPDDPDNYMDRAEMPANSPVFSWILGGIVGVASIVGLFIAQETPLTDLPWQTTENVSAPTHYEPSYFR